jgi:hypothetical protein
LGLDASPSSGYGRGGGKFLPTTIGSRILEFLHGAKSCAAKKSPASCAAAKEAIAEAVAIELMRSQRFPDAVSDSEAEDDKATMQRSFPNLSGVRKIIHLMVIRNESGSRSLYEVSDAAAAAGRLVGDIDTAFSEQLFDISETQREPEVEPDGVLDDLRREPDGRRHFVVFGPDAELSYDLI